MNFIKSFFSRLVSFFNSPKAQEAFDTAERYVLVAMPYIDMAAQVVVGLTPTTIDDTAWAMLHANYPQLFDGSILTQESRKLFALGVAGDLLKKAFPILSTSIARTAVQSAYLGTNAK